MSNTNLIIYAVAVAVGAAVTLVLLLTAGLDDWRWLVWILVGVAVAALIAFLINVVLGYRAAGKK